MKYENIFIDGHRIAEDDLLRIDVQGSYPKESESGRWINIQLQLNKDKNGIPMKNGHSTIAHIILGDECGIDPISEAQRQHVLDTIRDALLESFESKCTYRVIGTP